MPTKIQSPAYIAKQLLPGYEQKAWNSLWTEGKTFWDIGGPHPFLTNLFEYITFKDGFKIQGSSVFIPGCGRGHEAAYLANQGAIVTAIDYSPAAIAAAWKNYASVPGLQFKLADAFSTEPEEMETANIVVDRAMLCAIEPANRRQYLTACARRLKPDGLFMSIAFHEVLVPHGPPYTISYQELWTVSKDLFEIEYCRPITATTMTDYISQELLLILRKRRVNENN
jgi:SAM-dependent methyltransferase